MVEVLEKEKGFEALVESILLGEKSLSYSSLSQFLNSPKEFKKSKTDPEQTKAMEEGKEFHMACLEPEKFLETYYVFDDTAKCEELIKEGAKSPRSTAKYKEWKAEELAKYTGKTPLPLDDYNMYLAMSETLMTDPDTRDLMLGLTHKEFNFEIEYDWAKIRGSIDGKGEGNFLEKFGFEGHYTADLKKVGTATWDKIKWDIKRKNYHLQGALYSYVNLSKHHFLIYIDKDLRTLVVKLTQASLEEGMSRFEFGLEKFHECAETNQWNRSNGFFTNGYIEF